MIPIDRPQHLGRKTMALMILQGAVPGIALLIFVIILSFSKTNLELINSSEVITIGQIFPIIGNNLQNISENIVPMVFFLAILFMCIGIIINILRYQFFVFTLEEFGLRLRKGVLRVEEISIPYRQMQNVDVTRALVYRIFGISRLVVLSAGHEQADEGDQTDTVFDPIDSEIAEEIRVLLGRRIGVQVIEHETEADQQNIQAKSQKIADL
jgi:uncharacterized membrane protein YdbT with pleckstrin-like domain